MQLHLSILEELDRQAAAASQDRRVAEHIATMRMCWEEWQGPVVEDSIHGRVSVHTCIVHSLTHGQPRYHYMAPCRLVEIEPDGLHYIAVVDYAPDSHCAHLNGERLRLHITELWPPYREIIALREQHQATADSLILSGF